MSNITTALFMILAAATRLINTLNLNGIITPTNQARFEQVVDDLKTDCLNQGIDTTKVESDQQPLDVEEMRARDQHNPLD